MSWVELKAQTPGYHQAINMQRRLAKILKDGGQDSSIFVGAANAVPTVGANEVTIHQVACENSGAKSLIHANDIDEAVEVDPDMVSQMFVAAGVFSLPGDGAIIGDIRRST